MGSYLLCAKSRGRIGVNTCPLVLFSFLYLSFLTFHLNAQGQSHSRHHHHHHHHKYESQDQNDKPHLYLNEFAVEVVGGDSVAINLASRLGFTYQEKLPMLDDWYIFVSKRVRKRSLERFNRHVSKVKHLLAAPEVLACERLEAKKRVKRDTVLVNRPPNDPSWSNMWYMHCGTENSTFCPCSMRITEAWRAGYTGKGVVATILDDGIERNHPDLRKNYDPDASFDINNNDSDPNPRYDVRNLNKHGTRCAGVVAAVKDNFICGVGVAHGAKIGGVRMLDGEVTDKVEAMSLNWALNHVDIYSSSWGPDDDGTTVEGPGVLAKIAFERGVIKGRNGFGAIYIWASGNGGHSKDSCSCDGYINSIYTIGVSSVSQYGYRPWYLESCASTLASTYSSGESYEDKVVTTDLRKSCTHLHTGTSASAPMASGVVALALQANPKLTWRDVQHIIVRTSNSRGLVAPDWVQNGAGFNVSHVFGFGLMDAAAMAHVASSWNTVPAHKVCFNPPESSVRDIWVQRPLTVSIETRACAGTPYEVAYLEHVVLRISIAHPQRGALQIFLTSPSGTVSNILERRDFDRSKSGFNKWEFMTTHHWGENPMGVWQLEIRDNPMRKRYRHVVRRSQLLYWQLVLYGTQTHPQPNFNFSKCEAFPQDHCHRECLGCCGPTSRDCTRCRRVSNRQGECVAACERSQYVNQDNQMCMNCWSKCETCSGGGSHNCTSCFPGFTIIDGACVKICSRGYYVESVTQTCRKCDDVCKTCQERSYRCTSCRPGFRYEEGSCRASCGPGTYLVSIKSACGLCSASCRTCIDSPSRCTSCGDGYVLSRDRCTQVCQDSYYPDLRRKTCVQCHPTCRKCNGPRGENCTACGIGRTLSKGRCMNSCRDGYEKHYVSNPCLLVLRFKWCDFDVFRATCCHTCRQVNTVLAEPPTETTLSDSVEDGGSDNADALDDDYSETDVTSSAPNGTSGSVPPSANGRK